jgi:hypothetical protein
MGHNSDGSSNSSTKKMEGVLTGCKECISSWEIRRRCIRRATSRL